MRRILSLDGGGIRGIVTCCVLMELEKQAGKQCRDIFSFMAGTSTGSLLCSALAVGIPAKDILPIYTERAPREIFNNPLSDGELLFSGYRYESGNIATVLRSVFGRSNWTLNELPIRILITAVGVNKHPWYFVRDNPRNAGTTGKLSLIDCAVASAAAPTYFSPWYVSPLSGHLVGWCFDGGIGTVGNPVYRACVEAFNYDDFTPADTRVVSLGTGYFPQSSVNPPNGFLPTLRWTVDTLLDAPHDEQTQLVERHYPGILSRHDWQLPHSIDMADMASIPALVKVGQAAAASMDWGKILA